MERKYVFTYQFTLSVLFAIIFISSIGKGFGVAEMKLVSFYALIGLGLNLFFLIKVGLGDNKIVNNNSIIKAWKLHGLNEREKEKSLRVNRVFLSLLILAVVIFRSFLTSLPFVLILIILGVYEKLQAKGERIRIAGLSYKPEVLSFLIYFLLALASLHITSNL